MKDRVDHNLGKRVKLVIALKHRNVDRIEEVLEQVSTPDSPQYGQYWTQDQISELISPSQQDVQSVLNWLEAEGIRREQIQVNRRGDYLSVVLRTIEIESLLNAEINEFRHQETGTTRMGLIRYTVPCEVAPLIDFVAGLSRFPKFPRQKEIASPTLILTTPGVIRSAYSITMQPAPNTRNVQAIASFLQQYIKESDLTTFQQTFGLQTQAVSKIVGPNNSSQPGVEASLDIQYLMGIAAGIPTWVWSTPGENEFQQEPFLDWIIQVDEQYSPQNFPKIFSISYQDFEPSLSPSYMTRVSNEFALIGIKGITLCTGSGDWGTQCMENCTKFQPDFPSSSPFIVSTGATEFLTEDILGPSGATPWSSGGFSNVFKRPNFQDQVVRKFLGISKTPISYFNLTGRGFPDISTIGINFQVFVQGSQRNVGGTSAATPTFASILSLINDMRIAKSLPTLGWVNPFLYKAYASNINTFRDVTVGNNQYGCCTYGFDAVQGWDPLTGLGTPNATLLAEAAMSASLFPSFANK
eukprot:TRINITY_DN15565_c0_g1_i1.p1 TRINITY_DN15565_c0_g1~~TRINITY_DN15565_c0_g1_i1.p1  ORF type:complete len:568 (-),score=185.62 TRINITY_DN15565_c0_g1_i1:11-1585(-)